MAIKIYIDQGHNPGAVNAGASVPELEEQEVNYNVGTMLAGLLNHDERFKVRTSRTSPTYVVGYNTTSSLTTRVAEANAWPADYFVSVHANANTNPAVNGAEAYVYSTGTQAQYLAEHILERIVQIVGIRNNAVRTNPSLYVLRKTTMPAVLVELGYLTNSSDLLYLLNDQEEYAYAIYLGLLDYFGLQPSH
ncbi:N-acetylmuramoyl-L-alanine amidase [Lachnospiraceae bacterium ZAX-1]